MSGAHETARPWWNDRWLVAILLLSLVLKLALAFSAEPVKPVLDEKDYLNRARYLTENGDFPDLWRPPLYPAALALALELGAGTAGVRVAQAVLSVLSTLFVFRIGRAAFDGRTARIAVALFAFDPVLIGFSHLIWVETLYIFFFLAVADLLLVRFGLHRRFRWLAAGVLTGLAALVRPQILIFVPFILLWTWLSRRGTGEAPPAGDAPAPGLRRFAVGAGLLIAGCALAVLPWSAHNVRTAGAFVLVDTNGPYNLLLGTDPAAAFVDKDDNWDRRWAAIDGMPYRLALARDLERTQSRAIELAADNITADPARYLAKSAWEAGHLWTLDSFTLRHLRNGWYGEGVPAWVLPAATVICAGFTLLLVAAGFIGLVAQPPSVLRGFTACAVLHAVLLFGLLFSLSRHAVPLRPLLALSAAWVLADPAAAWQRLSNGRAALLKRGVPLLLILAALAWVWWRDIPLLGDMLFNGGSEYLFSKYP